MSEAYAGQPATPYLRVDLPRLRANIAAAAERATAAGVSMRPHAKTHKTPEIARLQLEAGAVGLTVATVGEAEAFVDGGADDVLIAYPLWVDRARARRLRALAERARVAIGIDSAQSAVRAARELGGADVEAMVEIDSGQGRSGVPALEAGALAAAAAEAGLRVRGVFTFPGHGYAPAGQADAAADEAGALRDAVASFRAAGLEPDVVSGGSTPTLAHTDTAVVTETRPGVYVFGDAQQWELGVIEPDAIALTCRATVVSHAGGRAVLDSGSKALGADRAGFATGWGRLLHHPDARIVQLSEHHAVVEMEPRTLPPLGSRVDVVPNHVCNAVNLTDRLWAVDGDEDRDEDRGVSWAVTARGRNA